MFWAQEVCNLQFRWLRPAISTVAIVTFGCLLFGAAKMRTLSAVSQTSQSWGF